jgi:hypothetical protein
MKDILCAIANKQPLFLEKEEFGTCFFLRGILFSVSVSPAGTGPELLPRRRGAGL